MCNLFFLPFTQSKDCFAHLFFVPAVAGLLSQKKEIMKYKFLAIFLLSATMVRAQMGNVRVQAGLALPTSKAMRGILKPGIDLGTAYELSIKEHSVLYLEGTVELMPFQGTSLLEDGILVAQVLGGYKHQFKQVFAKVGVGYTDLILGYDTYNNPIKIRSLGLGIGGGYTIKINKFKSLDVFSDFKLAGKKFNVTWLLFGVAYRFGR